MTTDTIERELTDQGFTGGLQDKLLAFYRRYGDSSAQSVTDAEISFLERQGIARSQVDDMWSEFLKDLPYNGDISERKTAFFLGRTAFKEVGRDRLMTEDGYGFLCEDASPLVIEYNSYVQEVDGTSKISLENKRFKLYDGYNLLQETGEYLFLEDEDQLILN